MTAKILTVAQQKGGAGKTTMAAHLAVAYTAAGKSVAAIDIDPQESLTQWYRRREARFGDAGAGLLVSSLKGWRLKNEVERLAREHDVVIVDSPPHAETEARIAVRGARYSRRRWTSGRPGRRSSWPRPRRCRCWSF